MTRSFIILSAAMVAACSAGSDESPARDEPTMPAGGDPVSIIRNDVRAEMDAEPLEGAPIRAVVGFPEGGSELDSAAVETLGALLAPGWVSSERQVTLWGHSDTVGSDEANFRAGEARARAVADYLEENGVRPERITIVSLGEGNPAEPNYLPDGSDNEEGQRANRRVEIEIAGLAEDADEAEAEKAGEAVERVKGIEPSS
ncbi:OmpA family protein [Sphingomicrobium nitratireducens]|uniref:OmpA family protein n=1 Tax=Sphingomicrobium nitratireducens TaxID=2964666 RepID=UPI002240AED5|nr:OmpA family protein [Sphingomicrobium nitratireducens]